ncbi:hypothetical protein [Desulfohalobium retbaense]|uniref:Uncharacterized protein n=1 Tax=Desulfohalobium retbaense (strain ATCC 49708 / DSM 5692 / JCM 16813 / HR100) TaxID=485915 RepID=C8X3I2_DESRD|nr:hypothetical protein [Desulfohalobium retbaense]ACV68979.1 hypothetical protein Dret_1695 [Desulfohalobium retbaense DSM 5692]
MNVTFQQFGRVFAFLVVLVFLALPAGALDDENGTSSPCQGSWELVKEGDWYIEQGDVQLPVSDAVRILGCTGDAIKLSKELHGVDVQVKCRVIQRGEERIREVVQLHLICW